MNQVGRKVAFIITFQHHGKLLILIDSRSHWVRVLRNFQPSDSWLLVFRWDIQREVFFRAIDVFSLQDEDMEKQLKGNFFFFKINQTVFVFKNEIFGQIFGSTKRYKKMYFYVLKQFIHRKKTKQIKIYWNVFFFCFRRIWFAGASFWVFEFLMFIFNFF